MSGIKDADASRCRCQIFMLLDLRGQQRIGAHTDGILQTVRARTAAQRHRFHRPVRCHKFYAGRTQPLFQILRKLLCLHPFGKAADPAEEKCSLRIHRLQAAAVAQANALCQQVVHTALCDVQVGVRTDDGDVAAQQMVNQRVLVDPLDWMKDDRMMGDYQLCAQLLCLAQHLLSAVQRQQRTLHLLLTVTHQDAGVIKIHRQEKGASRSIAS